uniref:Uncharacterized protein n=1 Tax=Glossina pallidipes TaxID=7398 RepID=A0A1B0ADM2_GLOPL
MKCKAVKYPPSEFRLKILTVEVFIDYIPFLEFRYCWDASLFEISGQERILGLSSDSAKRDFQRQCLSILSNPKFEEPNLSLSNYTSSTLSYAS